MAIERRIRVLIVDDQRLMRDGLRTLLELEPDTEVVAEAEDGESALLAYEAHRSDKVLAEFARLTPYYGPAS